MLLILVILAFAAPIAAYVSTRPCKDDLFVFSFFRRKEEAKWEWEACADILDDVILISDEILNKEEQLTDEEKRLINEHPVKGAAILEPIDELNRIIPIIRHHHEHWDGSGYPDGLSGNEIPLGARILSVADAFDAMISDRPYRQRYSPAAARREIINCSGAYFDPQAVGAFIMAMERHGLGEELSEEYGI